MNRDIPIPGSTKHKLINVGIQLFSAHGYVNTEVEEVASKAGVTVGALYHHFKSKLRFYGLIRDDMTLRILDRMEAVVEVVPADTALLSAVLSAYDGMLRLQVGFLLAEPDPRNEENKIAKCLEEIAISCEEEAARELGILLAESLRAALYEVVVNDGDPTLGRTALSRLLSAK
ncbi:TetR/AcrR family transcriptional regulator [Aureibacillus halotolerans]|uniref:TetR family transcriptional regulator n=1 Tax=Aureibacillus halotolerans TaxID=1508390 RepID=A0A4R6TTX3_9BACI|nr:TetR/AcrR family transcriptional regulator [Aureibacillus halotolerans]TDQ36566.1 TetR family transcriptional regulator [Aureibacillus halotolerans]